MSSSVSSGNAVSNFLQYWGFLSRTPMSSLDIFPTTLNAISKRSQVSWCKTKGKYPFLIVSLSFHLPEHEDIWAWNEGKCPAISVAIKLECWEVVLYVEIALQCLMAEKTKCPEVLDLTWLTYVQQNLSLFVALFWDWEALSTNFQAAIFGTYGQSCNIWTYVCMFVYVAEHGYLYKQPHFYSPSFFPPALAFGRYLKYGTCGGWADSKYYFIMINNQMCVHVFLFSKLQAINLLYS